MCHWTVHLGRGAGDTLLSNLVATLWCPQLGTEGGMVGEVGHCREEMGANVYWAVSIAWSWRWSLVTGLVTALLGGLGQTSLSGK